MDAIFVSAELAPPRYWRDETSGVLASAIYLYLTEREKVTVGMIAYIRAYLRQWIMSPVWDQNPSADDEARAALKRLRDTIDGITSVKAIDRWLHDALDEGIDPL